MNLLKNGIFDNFEKKMNVCMKWILNIDLNKFEGWTCEISLKRERERERERKRMDNTWNKVHVY